MTRHSTRNAGRIGFFRENPDVLALTLLALALLVVNPSFAASVRPVLDGGIEGAPWVCESQFFQRGSAAVGGPRFRLSPIASADTLPKVELRLDDWGARIDARRDRLWQRLEQRMRDLELRFLIQQRQARTRTVSTRGE